MVLEGTKSAEENAGLIKRLWEERNRVQRGRRRFRGTASGLSFDMAHQRRAYLDLWIVKNLWIMVAASARVTLPWGSRTLPPSPAEAVTV